MSPALLKTTTYCVMHLVVAVAVAFALTRSWKAALAIGLVEPFVQTFAFALHERLWSRASRSAPAQGESPHPRVHACAHSQLPIRA